jgi:hypothetical protein
MARVAGADREFALPLGDLLATSQQMNFPEPGYHMEEWTESISAQ